MQVDLKTFDNEIVGKLSLPEDIFSCQVRSDIISRVVHWQLARRRSGTHHTKRIGEISGTTKKPFRQKGTGNARQGSLRSPHMRGGATMHGPKFRSYDYALPKKIRSLGLKSALSDMFLQKRVCFFENFDHSGKCAELVKQLKSLDMSSVLFIDGPEVNKGFYRAISNVIGVDVLPIQGANVYDIISHDNLVFSKSGLEGLEVRLK